MKVQHYFEMTETMVHSSGLSVEINYSRRRKDEWLIVASLVAGSRGSVEVYREEMLATVTLEQMLIHQRTTIGALVSSVGRMVAVNTPTKLVFSEEQTDDDQN